MSECRTRSVPRTATPLACSVVGGNGNAPLTISSPCRWRSLTLVSDFGFECGVGMGQSDFTPSVPPLRMRVNLIPGQRGEPIVVGAGWDGRVGRSDWNLGRA